jgi:16S rRNA (guanine1207-N2)-methyltransferase
LAGYGCAVSSTGEPAASDEPSQYFQTEPTVQSKPRSIELVLPDVYLNLTTDTGVFSGERVDGGSRYLMQGHPPIPSHATTILDLGCGYGPIGLAAAKRAPAAQVWGIDVNARAVRLASMNAEANAITNARFTLTSDLPSDLSFDLILSNPPIRIGKSALHELLTTWLDRLSPGGVAWMVVQKHLGSDSLASWLSEQGWETTRLGSRKGFRILQSHARPGPLST